MVDSFSDPDTILLILLTWKDLLADTEGHLKTPLEGCVLIKVLQCLHAQIAIAGVAVSEERIEQPAARSVGLALRQRPVARALINHDPRVVFFGRRYNSKQKMTPIFGSPSPYQQRPLDSHTHTQTHSHSHTRTHAK